MNWKEQFDDQIKGIADIEVRDGKWVVERDEVIEFISTEIIEKVIDEIPEMYFDDGFMFDTETASRIKQQLRDKWL